jgi:hypothetical protein
MAGNKRDDQSNSARGRDGSDSEQSLQQELARESAEGGDVIGDMRQNRDLSGSSTWETLPDAIQSREGGERGETF